MANGGIEMVWVAVIGGWMTTLFEVRVASNLKSLSEEIGSDYVSLRRLAVKAGDGAFFVKRDGGVNWAVKRVRLVRVGGRGGKREKGVGNSGNLD